MTRIVGFMNSRDGNAAMTLRRVIPSCHPHPIATCKSANRADYAVAVAGPTAGELWESEQLVIAIDGQIYNRSEVGDFESDAAAIASLYKKYGFTEMLRALNGDFAIALYDEASESLWLGRDRFGIKPLYYSLKGDSFAFASRPKALLEFPFVSSEVNRKFVALFAGSHYRYFDNDPDASPYADIQQLPAAHALKFHAGASIKIQYWRLEELPDWTESEAELAERYRDLLLDAVSIRFRSAKNPAFTLSGGMDSSSVLASAVWKSGAKQPAMSTVYSDRTYDEADDIRAMLDSAVSKWYPVRVDDPDVFSVVRQMVQVHDEPVATATWLSHYLLCEQAAQHGFGSLFGGLGGDELNAGEFEHFIYFFADLRRMGSEGRLQREIQKWIEYHDHPIYRKSAGLVEDQFRTVVDLRMPGKCLPERNRLRRYISTISPDYFELQKFEPVLDHPFASYLKNRTSQDLFRETIPCCLRAEDRNCAAFGIDHSLPFFDYRLVEFMFRVPTPLKYGDGVTKLLLRRAMQGILNETTRTRVKKTGWNAPAHAWFAGRCRDQLLDTVHSSAFQQRGIYDVSEVQRIVDEHFRIVAGQETKESHMMFLWQLVNLELWLESLDRPAKCAA